MSATDRGSTPRKLPAGRTTAPAAHVAEVAERVEVSIDTVRRDLDHGGAVSLTPAGSA